MYNSKNSTQFPLSIKILEVETKKLQRLLGEASEICLKSPVLLEPNENQIDDLYAFAKSQQEKQKVLIQKHKAYSEVIKKRNADIEELSKTKLELEESLSLSNEEYKNALKPLIKAIKKYSTNLDMRVDIKKHEIEKLFVASVKFSSKPNCKSVTFILDLKNRRILDFDATSLMNEEEVKKLKKAATTEDGWNLDIILKKLRECSI